jgi:hypothetical protein
MASVGVELNYAMDKGGRVVARVWVAVKYKGEGSSNQAGLGQVDEPSWVGERQEQGEAR